MWGFVVYYHSCTRLGTQPWGKWHLGICRVVILYLNMGTYKFVYLLVPWRWVEMAHRICSKILKEVTIWHSEKENKIQRKQKDQQLPEFGGGDWVEGGWTDGINIIFRGVKLFHMILQCEYMSLCIGQTQIINCTTQRVNRNVNYGL